MLRLLLAILLASATSGLAAAGSIHADSDFRLTLPDGWNTAKSDEAGLFLFRSPGEDAQVSISVLHPGGEGPGTFGFRDFEALFAARKEAEETHISARGSLILVEPEERDSTFVASLSGADPASGRRFDALLVGNGSRIVVCYVETLDLSEVEHRAYVDSIMSWLSVA